jgi:hypothetical protein
MYCPPLWVRVKVNKRAISEAVEELLGIKAPEVMRKVDGTSVGVMLT